MFKDGVLTINYDTWKDGIAPSAFSGLADLRNVDIHTKPGALLCGFKAVKESSTTVTSLPKFMVYDDANDIAYAVDEGGVVYKRVSGSWSSFATGKGHRGLALWKKHLIVADSSNIDVYDIDGDSWSNSWQAFAEGTRNAVSLPHTMLHAQDDVLYITDGVNIASLTEAAGSTFDPSSGSTYTWNSSALDLPEDYVAHSLTEYGDALIIGTYFTEATNRGNKADTFVWTPTSDTGTFTFDDTQKLKGNGVWLSTTQGNYFYQLVDRNSGRIYVSNLSTYEKLHELKNIDFGGNNLDLYPDAIETVDDQILFGIGSNTTGLANLGVYGMKDGILHIKNTVSAGDTRVEIGSILAVDGTDYLIGWDDGTNSGVDLVSTTRMDSYGSVLVTAFYTIGTALEKRSLTQMNLSLGKPLSTGQGVRVSYRTNLSDSFTVVETFDFDTYGAVSQMGQVTNISSASQIQLKLELTSATSSTDSPEFISLDIY